MRSMTLIIIILALHSLMLGCQSSEVDEEGWIEAGYIPPPDAPKAEPQEENEDAAVAATETDAPTPAPAAAPAPQDPTPAPRSLSSAEPKPFKAGLNTFSKNCQMKKDASADSDKVGFIKKGKKLWVDKHNADWGKVYRKSGHAFVSADCL